MRKAYALLTLPLLLAIGCGDDTAAPGDMAPDLSHTVDPLAIACTDSVDSVYQLPANLPAFDPSHRGDIIRCAFDRALPAATVNTALTTLGYTGPAVHSDLNVYRIAYRTERVQGSASAAPGGVSSALVLMPSNHRTDAYVVTAHGTVGLADSCVPSKFNLADGTTGEDAQVFDLALPGDGWITIAPDYAGFGYGGPVSGWSLAEDEAHSLLDATRAMKNFLQPTALPPKVAFMGHSQGAHAVLSVQPLIATYGSASPVIGVAPMGVLWVSDRSWGASIDPPIGITTSNAPYVVAYSMYYFYSHGELYDGPGHGLDMFKASQRDAVKTLLTTSCDDNALAGKIQALGAQPSDIYDDPFWMPVANCMIFNAGCATDPAKTWLARAKADRPAIDPAGPPILFWHGLQDTTISPGRAQCGIDKIETDLAGAANPTATLTVCGDPGATHSSIVRRDIDYVSQWIAARAAGMPNPAGCGPFAAADGGTFTCTEPPPND